MKNVSDYDDDGQLLASSAGAASFAAGRPPKNGRI